MVPQWRCGPRAEPAAPLATKTSRKVRNVTALHQPAPPVVASRGTRRRCPGSRRLFRLAPTTAAATAPRTRHRPASRSWSPQANDADDYYAQIAAAYTEETGVEIEVIPYPSDAYNTQVTTQLQAGNAADMMILVARHRPADLGHHPRRGRLPRAARRDVGGRRSCRRQRGALPGRRRDLRASRRRSRPSEWSSTSPAGEEVGIDATPRRTTICSTACTTARDARQDLHRARRRRSRSTRACSRSSSRRPASTRRPRLERAARRGRCDLRRQRLATRCSKTSSR